MEGKIGLGEVEKMKYKSRKLTPNKYPKSKLQLCKKCGKPQDREDLKFGCMRCEYRAKGFDVPKKVEN